MATPNEDSEKHLVTGFLRKLPNEDMSWYDLMDKMIGSKKHRFSDIMVPPVGIPQAPRLPEEIRIQRAMDSCLFKSIMSCVIGKCLKAEAFLKLGTDIYIVCLCLRRVQTTDLAGSLQCFSRVPVKCGMLKVKCGSSYGMHVIG